MPHLLFALAAHADCPAPGPLLDPAWAETPVPTDMVFAVGQAGSDAVLALLDASGAEVPARFDGGVLRTEAPLAAGAPYTVVALEEDLEVERLDLTAGQGPSAVERAPQVRELVFGERATHTVEACGVTDGQELEGTELRVVGELGDFEPFSELRFGFASVEPDGLATFLASDTEEVDDGAFSLTLLVDGAVCVVPAVLDPAGVLHDGDQVCSDRPPGCDTGASGAPLAALALTAVSARRRRAAPGSTPRTRGRRGPA